MLGAVYWEARQGDKTMAVEEVKAVKTPVVPVQEVEVTEEAVMEAAARVDEAAARINETVIGNFPDPGRAIAEAFAEMERRTNALINKHLSQVEKNREAVNQLLDLLVELNEYKKDTEMSKELKERLKASGVWKGDANKLSEQQLSSLKSTINGKIEQYKAENNSTLSVYVQKFIGILGTKVQVAQDAIRNRTQLIRAAVRLPGH